MDYGGNLCVQLGVICEHFHPTLDGIGQIVDIDQKQEWAENRALGDSAGDRCPLRVSTFENYPLPPCCQEGFYPGENVARDSIVV